MTIEAEGQLCGCGARGCLETISSLSGIKLALQKLEAEDWFKRNIEGNDSDRYPELLGQLARQGDRQALKLLDRMGSALGIAVANLLNAFDIHCYIFGGGIGNLFELFAPGIEREVKQRAHGFEIERLKLRRAKLGQDAGILGAAYLALGI